jgi:hypothetical protein
MRFVIAMASLVTGIALGRLSKRTSSRDVLKTAIRIGFVTSNKVRAAVAEVKEELSDVAAEMRNEQASQEDLPRS